MERKRDIDILKGIGIFLMVFDHVGWGSFVHSYIQSFHMPLFFIVSGFLWKDRDTATLAKKRFQSSMIPYLCFGGAYAMMAIACYEMGIYQVGIRDTLRAIVLYPTDMAHIPLAPALWFLPCFFLSNLLYGGALRKLNGVKRVVVVILIATVGMTYSSITDLMLPFAIEPTATAIFFIWIGDCIKDKMDNVEKYSKKVTVIAGILVVHLSVVLLNGSVDLRSARYNNCILYVIGAVSGTLLWWIVSNHLADNKNELISKCSKVLVYLSISSITFLCMNQPFITVFESIRLLVPVEGVIFKAGGRLAVFTLVLLSCYIANEQINKTGLKRVLGK